MAYSNTARELLKRRGLLVATRRRGKDTARTSEHLTLQEAQAQLEKAKAAVREQYPHTSHEYATGYFGFTDGSVLHVEVGASYDRTTGERHHCVHAAAYTH